MENRGVSDYFLGQNNKSKLQSRDWLPKYQQWYGLSEIRKEVLGVVINDLRHKMRGVISNFF
jgi:hypothetical protein